MNHYRFHFGTCLLEACGAKDPKNTKNMSSELIFKDINLIFFQENFLKITELNNHYKYHFNIFKSTKHYRFHFGTFLLGACGAKDSKNTKNMSSELIFKGINLIFLIILFFT